MSSLAFADVLESAREAGTSRFSAANIANALDLQHQDLAILAGVHATRCALTLNLPSSRPPCVT